MVVRSLDWILTSKKLISLKPKELHAINPGAGTDPVKFVQEATNDVGADGVIITASSKSNEIIHQAAEMSRKKGTNCFGWCYWS